MNDANQVAIDRAKELLGKVSKAHGGLQQRLLLAAAISSVTSQPTVVVGGTAEEFWAGGEYYPTDLDLCPSPAAEDEAKLIAIGLTRDGRHWTAANLPVAVEFPGSGADIERTFGVKAGGVTVQVLSCEEIYLDRVRQATVGWPREDGNFDAAVEIALTNFYRMDWDYVRDRIERVAPSVFRVKEGMKAINRRIRSRVRRLHKSPSG